MNCAIPHLASMLLFLDGKPGNLGSFDTNQKPSLHLYLTSLASTSACSLKLIGHSIKQSNRFNMRSDNLIHQLKILFVPMIKIDLCAAKQGLCFVARPVTGPASRPHTLDSPKVHYLTAQTRSYRIYELAIVIPTTSMTSIQKHYS